MAAKQSFLNCLIFSDMNHRVNALPATMWNFIKTNWFTIAIVLLLLVAIGRNNPRFKSWNADRPAVASDKYTDANPGAAARLDLFGSVSGEVTMPSIDDATAVAFLKRFGNLSVNERKKFGIPPSVLLACAYVNSHSGQRIAALQVNNFFALPCGGDWTGAVATLDGQCFRRYDTAWASFRDFGVFVSHQSWFEDVRKSAGTDWQQWLKMLDGKSISDVRNNTAEMRTVIETYRLFELDGQ